MHQTRSTWIVCCLNLFMMKLLKPKSSSPALGSCVLVLCSVITLINHARAFVTIRPSSSPKLCGLTSPSTAAKRTTCSLQQRVLSMRAASGGGEQQLSRGVWTGRVLAAALGGVAAVSQIATPALAELGVGEGGLPDGARQFSNFLKVQRDWVALGKTVNEKKAGVSDEEWKNIALFLRKVYQVGNDLEFLGGQFSGDKKKTALDLVRNIQKEVQAADVPARERNVDAFVAALSSVEKKFDAFSEMFQDVPSEL